MTRLEFALKNFRVGDKLVVTEDKISTFGVAKILTGFTEECSDIAALVGWNESPEEKSVIFYDRRYIEQEHSGFDFYLVKEIY